MKAIRVHEYGGPSVLKLEEVADPKPGPGEIVVRVRAAGINPVDVYIVTGTYPRKPPLPYTPGQDGAGEIQSVGADVKGFKAGDRVYICGVGNTVAGAGTYAELALCVPSQLHHLPARVSFGQGAALGVPSCTAYRALFQRTDARPGETVLVHGATGGVGIAAVELAHARGLTVIGSGGTDAGLAAAREHGADVVVNHRQSGYTDEIMKATGGKGVDLIVEMAAHVNLDRDLGLLAKYGRVVVVGNRGKTEIDARGAMGRDASILGMTLFNVTEAEFVEIHAGLIAGLANGTLSPVVGKEIPLAEAPRAHEAVMEPGALGKIVLSHSMMRTHTSTLAMAAGLIGALAWAARGGMEAQPRGKAIYDAHCVECHGDGGKGDGPSAAYLVPRPRDFTTGKYKIRSTESGTMPTDDDLIGSVRRGLYATAMPGWDRILSDADIADVVQYVKSLSPRFAAETPKPIALGDGLPSSPASIARGQQAYDKLQCGKCHGSDGRGTGAVTAAFEDDWRMPLRAADLTEPWTFHGGATSRDIYLRFRTGMTGTPMPSFADAASDAEMRDLANYVVSLARKPVWSMDAAEVQQFYTRQAARAKADPARRGAELVETLGCVLCHSPVDAQKRILPGMKMAGGLLIRITPFGDFPTGNLTSDRATGLGNWSSDEIKRAITKGILRDGSRLLPYPMDYGSYSTLTPDDLDAIVAYLRTVPPVSNKVPAPSRPFLPVYLWGKFQMLILGGDPPMVFFSGNAGAKGAP